MGVTVSGDDMSAFVARVSGLTAAGASRARKRIAFGIFRRVTKRSQVDTGRMRASTNLSAGMPNTSTVPPVSRRRNRKGKAIATYGQPVLTPLPGVVPEAVDLWINNSTEYAPHTRFPADLHLAVREEVAEFNGLRTV